MYFGIVGDMSNGLLELLNGKFGVLQLFENQAQRVACFRIPRFDRQVLSIALNRHIELTLLVGNPSQNKDGAGVSFFLQYPLADILGLVQTAFLEMLQSDPGKCFCIFNYGIVIGDFLLHFFGGQLMCRWQHLDQWLQMFFVALPSIY